MKKLVFGSVVIMAFIAGSLSCCSAKKSPEKGATTDTVHGFAIMELFTSQGCSSCPPADELLGKYAAQNNPNIIPLSFHVDYWNRLGWKDSFSDAAFSQRQRTYASQIVNSSVYTPQLVINGVTEMVGSEVNKVEAAVKMALLHKPSATIVVNSTEIKKDAIVIGYNITGNVSKADVLALLVQTKANTKIKAGENNGAMLTSYNVVRSMQSMPAKPAGTCTLALPSSFEKDKFSVVLLIQQKDNLAITGAARVKL
ncbi:DUF1223 domain-containing protein [Ferruginibacter paludis]|uniref:DUF1223 domain-containing protein n=1 Tax=Ferruginibacter paludis TaxID=1310417 RepID=UPI0025B3AD02|nr:DUF1223 domain-containing protein [Ferruginibacter paludis]MDN3658756.1 DUF1223 domain-containing protein [Ferruginibacter paludis]